MRKLIYIVLGLLLCTTIYADEKNDCLNFHVINSEPLGYLDENNAIAGIHVDILKEIEKHSTLCINKILMPYARIWQNIKYGKHDGGFIFKSESRNNLVDYVAPLGTVKIIIISKPTIKIERYNDLSNLTIAIKRKSHYSDIFDRDSTLNKVQVNSDLQALKLLLANRADAVVGPNFSLAYQLNKLKKSNNIDFSNTFELNFKAAWLQLSKKSKHLDKIPELQKAIKLIQKNGSLKRISKKYYGDLWEVIN